MSFSSHHLTKKTRPCDQPVTLPIITALVSSPDPQSLLIFPFFILMSAVIQKQPPDTKKVSGTRPG